MTRETPPPDTPARRPVRPPRMSFARLWAVLAILLPVLAALIANLSSVDLAYHLRAGGEILDGAGIPRDRHVDVHRVRRAVARPAVGRPGHPGRRLPARPAGPGSSCCGRSLVGLAVRARVPRLPAPRRRPPTGGLADPRGVRRLGGRPRPPAAALRDGAVRARPRPARAAAASGRGSLWAIPVVVAALGEPPRQLLPRAGRRRPRLARGRRRHATAAPAGRSRSRSSSALAALVTPFGPAVWAYAVGLVDERRGHRPDHGVAADDAPDACPGSCSSRRRSPSSSCSPGAATRDPVADARLARRLLRRSARTRSAASRGGRSAPCSPSRRSSPARSPSSGRSAAWRRPAQRRRSSARSSSPASRCCPSGARSTPASQAPSGVVGNAPPGITAALREQAAAGDRLFNPQPWGSWFEFAFPDVAGRASIRGSSSSRPRSGTTTRRSIQGRDGWQAILDRWGVTLVVVPTADDGTLATASRGRLARSRQRRRRLGSGTPRHEPLEPALVRVPRRAGTIADGDPLHRGWYRRLMTRHDPPTSTSSSSAAAATSACRSASPSPRPASASASTTRTRRRSTGSPAARCRSSRPAPTSSSARSCRPAA